MTRTAGWWVPVGLRGYQRSWLVVDVVAGLTLSAVAIPEVMGYTTISQTPVVTGLYTVIFPAAAFALLGASRLLVVGADSATAALLSSGLATAAIPGLTPGSPTWVAACSLTALVCAVMLVLARLLRLGFLGDFLSASVLIGFLSGVGVSVLTGQIPAMLGVPKGTGNWFQQQWTWLRELPDISWTTFAFTAATIVVILGLGRVLPRAPGAIIAVVGLILVSAATDAAQHGVAVVGSVAGGFPPLGLPPGLTAGDAAQVLGIAFSCFIVIISQSAATSRSFAMLHGDRVDVNRDLVGLAAANLAAGLSGTFVVNGSPTKTQILDEERGRTQVANLTMAAVVLLFTLFFTRVLTNMPQAVLAGIVFMIGVALIDPDGLRRVWSRRRSEFVIAVGAGVVVFVWGVEQGVVLAVVASILEIIRRQYKPKDFVIGVLADEPTYEPAVPGHQSEPGLIVFRYDAELFYANANRFVDDVQAIVEHAPDPVRWVVLDAASIVDIDYSAGLALAGLYDYLEARGVTIALARADVSLLKLLETYHLRGRFPDARIYGNLHEAVAAFRALPPAAEPVIPAQRAPARPRRGLRRRRPPTGV
ncbi:MAG: SulP family inorganic anion transporter [Nocardioidaceae bacterium]